ncbi:MAG: hypothetical protein ACREMS_03610 [Gemmatimonadaceae bacterium]
MADFTKKSIADMAQDKPDINFGTSGSMHEIDWPMEDEYWRANYHTRPYAQADRGYEHYRSAYRYGAESAGRFAGSDWDSVEPHLKNGWSAYRADAKGAWHDIKEAVRDGWNRVTIRS